MSGADAGAPDLPRLELAPPEDWAPGMRVVPVVVPSDGDGPAAPFKASRFTVAPGTSTPLDRHSVREIWFIADGSGELTWEGTSRRVETGDVLYFPSETGHTVHNDGPGVMTVFSVWWPPDA